MTDCALLILLGQCHLVTVVHNAHTESPVRDPSWEKRDRVRVFMLSCALGRPQYRETNFWQWSHFQGNGGGPFKHKSREGKALFPGY